MSRDYCNTGAEECPKDCNKCQKMRDIDLSLCIDLIALTSPEPAFDEYDYGENHRIS